MLVPAYRALGWTGSSGPDAVRKLSCTTTSCLIHVLEFSSFDFCLYDTLQARKAKDLMQSLQEYTHQGSKEEFYKLHIGAMLKTLKSSSPGVNMPASRSSIGEQPGRGSSLQHQHIVTK